MFKKKNFELKNVKKLPNGDFEYSFKTSPENIEKLKEMYGENYEEEFSKDFAKYIEIITKEK